MLVPKAFVEFQTPYMEKGKIIGVMIPDVDASDLRKRIDAGEKLYLVGKRKPNASN